MYKCLKRGCKDNRARLFPVVSTGMAGGNKHKLKHRSILLNMKQHFSPVRVNEQANRLPREVVESSYLKILKSCLDMVLGKWLQVTLPEWGVGQDGPQKSLPISIIL